jgi:hypothetical protein
MLYTYIYLYKINVSKTINTYTNFKNTVSLKHYFYQKRNLSIKINPKKDITDANLIFNEINIKPEI